MLLSLSLLSQTAMAQVDWGSFQSGISASGNSGQTSGSTSSGSTTVVSTESGVQETASIQNANCAIEKETQSTLPLSILNALSSKTGFWKIKLDPASDRVSLQSDVMVGNCNNMLEIKTSRSKSSPTVHYVAVGIKDGKTVNDFSQCIVEKTYTDGKFDPKKVKRDTLSFSYGFEQSGEFKFLSEGPLALDMGGVYSGIDYKGCMAVEAISKDGFQLKTLADRDKEQRSKDVAGICQADDYKKITDELIAKYQDYKNILEKLRNDLLLNEVKELSKSIQTGDDFASLDFSVIADFQKYIIDPITQDIKATFQELKGAQGESKKLLEKKLKDLKAKLGAFKKSPYLTEADYNKMKVKGPVTAIDAAEELFALRTTIVEFEKVNNLEDGNKRVTPEVAQIRTNNAIKFNKPVMAKARLIYQIRKHEVTGTVAKLKRDADNLLKGNEIRTKNYQAAMQKMIQKGYKKCQYSFNQRNCMNKVARKIQAMQVNLEKINTARKELADKMYADAREYEPYEQEGREYARAQNDEGTSETGNDTYVGYDEELYPTVDDQFDFDFDSGSNTANNNNQFNFNQQNPFQFQNQNPFGQGQQQNQFNTYNQYDQFRNPAYFQGNTGFNSGFNSGFNNNNYYNSSPFGANLNFGAGTGYYNQGGSPFGNYYNQPVFGQQQGQYGNAFNFGQFQQ